MPNAYVLSIILFVSNNTFFGQKIHHRVLPLVKTVSEQKNDDQGYVRERLVL